jgi:hypothetical protein
MKPKGKQNSPEITFDTVRELVGHLPGVIEGTSYGTPAFKVGKTLFVRLHQDGEALVVRFDHDHRSMRMRADPETFFLTDHYLNFPWILVRLSTVDKGDLGDLLEEAWRLSAPKRLLSDLEQQDKVVKKTPNRKPRTA